MGFLADIRAAWSAPSVNDETPGLWRTGSPNDPYLVGAVTEFEALGNPVVFDCVNILMDAVGQSPTILYDRTGDGERERADSPLAYRLREQPNDDQTAIEFKRQMQQSACFYEFAYAEIEWRGADPVNVWPRHPTRVHWAKTGRGGKYEYLEDDRTWRPILPANMLRIPGRPVLKYAGDTLTHAIALERYSRNMFTKSPRPSAVIEAEKGVSYSDEQRTAIKAALVKNHAGWGSGQPLWMPDGLHLNPYGMTNQEAEYGAIRTSLVGDIARYWRIPPYMIGLLESGTVSYASVNTQGVDFVVYCLMPWLVGWEQALQRDLIVDKGSQFVEFLTAQLLRGTTAERYDVYAVAIQNGIMSVNEVRRLENLNPRAGGDVYLAPLNMAPQARHIEAGSPADRLLQALTADAAGNVIRREQGALAKLAERSGSDVKAWEQGVRDFYDGHAAYVAEKLKLPTPLAAAYATAQQFSVLSDGPAVAATWNGAQTDRLAQLALGGAK